MYCNNCGTNIGDLKFCPSCGTEAYGQTDNKNAERISARRSCLCISQRIIPSIA